jgi:cytochrome P450
VENVESPLPVFPPVRPPLGPPEDYARFRESEPVKAVETPSGTKAWLVTRYADIREMLRGEGLSSDPRTPGFPAFVGFRRLSADGTTPRIPLVDMDQPEHTLYRRVVAPELTMRAVSRLVPAITELVDSLLDAMERSGPPADLVASFTSQIPSRVICRMLGFPPEDSDYFYQFAEEANAEQTSLQRRVQVQREMSDYIARQVAVRENLPGEEFIDRLLAARDSGILPPDEVVNVARMMYSAGVGTTANALALSVAALLVHRDQAAVIADEKADLPRAVEELLRWTSIVHGLARVTRSPLEIQGRRIPTGEGVLLALPAANHDPEAFPDPDRLDLTRTPGDQLGFGQGIHQCPGQQLARAELQIGLSRLFRRFPSLSLRVSIEELEYKKGFVHGVKALPVEW